MLGFKAQGFSKFVEGIVEGQVWTKTATFVSEEKNKEINFSFGQIFAEV